MSVCERVCVSACVCSTTEAQNVYLGLARTIYIRFTYGIFGREITKDTVIYGVYIWFWPTLRIPLQCHCA